MDMKGAKGWIGGGWSMERLYCLYTRLCTCILWDVLGSAIAWDSFHSVRFYQGSLGVLLFFWLVCCFHCIVCERSSILNGSKGVFEACYTGIHRNIIMLRLTASCWCFNVVITHPPTCSVTFPIPNSVISLRLPTHTANLYVSPSKSRLLIMTPIAHQLIHQTAFSPSSARCPFRGHKGGLWRGSRGRWGRPGCRYRYGSVSDLRYVG